MKVVATGAVMDLCHRGHLNLLKEMRKEAGETGKVIIFLHDDKSIYETKGKIPIQNWKQRRNNIEITGFADRIEHVGNYDSLSAAIEDMVSDWPGVEFVWMRGDDWKDFPAKETIEKLGIKMKFIKYTEGVSSTVLRKELETL